MKICKNCTYFETSKNEWEKPLGLCINPKWYVGYDFDVKKLEQDQIVVEGDEGWGALMMPEFGCVLHKDKMKV